MIFLSWMGCNHRALFFSTLSKGYYAPPQGFVSWEERQELAKLQAAQEKLRRLNELKRGQRETEFEIWVAELPSEKKRRMLAHLSDPKPTTVRLVLRQAFADENGLDDDFVSGAEVRE